MIDQELDQLSRALIAATDRLNSEDFRARQARYIALEQEFLALGNELEAEEKAVEAAQAALTSYVNGNYLDLGGVADQEPAEEQWSDEQLKAWKAEQAQPAQFNRIFTGGFDAAIEPLSTEEDEYATAKANGALS